MRAIINIGFQFVLACTLLMCITCNRFDQTKSHVSLITKKQNDFVLNQIKVTKQLIQLAEIGELKGNAETSVRASEIKDNQVVVLYHWIDYAGKKDIEIPVVTADSSATHLYNSSGNFDSEWNQVVEQRMASTISELTGYSASEDADMAVTIKDVMNTFEVKMEPVQLVADN